MELGKTESKKDHCKNRTKQRKWNYNSGQRDIHIQPRNSKDN